MAENAKRLTEADCPACADWQANRISGQYRSDCDDCAARAIAGSPAAWRASSGITAVELQDGIRRAFKERYTEGRRLVWKWIGRLKEGKA
jgi:hypothetical protein